nr:immunoglobulin light chain junction region [Mus musculus]NSL97930.1 immunoglobulin light chain junction region [Mus musculus]NSL98124.1 immunoglobulin light chain junction region [Mus musculus]NSL99248.1 immunoglobulin light chain junction region [Mus musculus]NSM00723.1 immunoglobulin light chain junction region [Mus musculus]
CHHSRELPWTF